MKFDGNYFDAKMDKKMSKIEKIRYFAAYTAACWPARFGWNKLKLIIFVLTG